FLRDLEAHARELLVIQALGEVPPELAITPERDERLLEQAGRAGRADVVRILDLLGDAFEALKAGSEPRVQLELALVKAAAPELDASTRALQARIERLEEQLAGRGAAPVVRAVGEPLPEAPARAGRETSGAEPESAVGAGAGAVAAAAVVAVAAVEPHPEVEVQAAQPHPARDSAEGDLDLDGLRSVWPAILVAVRDQNAMLAALLEGATPIALTSAPAAGAPGGELTVAFAESAAFLKRKAEVGANREALARAIQTVSGRMVRLAYELRADASDGEGPTPPTPQLSEEALLARFMAEFDAEELSDEQEEEPS
ncbi:MAG: hypothetical protein M3Z33_03500, partial [Actinomycetota bacterium]|nr:hypothetical protein [Actinomycetota bacterium]